MALDFEHFTGFNAISNGAVFHPDGSSYVGSAGGNVIITDLMDSAKQEFLRGHTENVTCISVSPSGALIASGQQGDESNVFVWDFETRKRIFCIEEHDGAVQAVAFSHDEKILATAGNSEDRKLYTWDMSTGNIIAFSNKLPVGTLCVEFGGFIRDIKRRDTDHYQLVSGGKDGVMLWDMDPYEGELLPLRVGMDARASLTRTVTSLSFSTDCEYLYGATTTGDYLVASMKAKKILSSVQATKRGLTSILASNDGGVLVGCGDSTIKTFDKNFEYTGQIELDGNVVGLCRSADGMEALAATSAGSVFRVNIGTKQHITIAEAHTAACTAASFSVSSADRLATASVDGTVRVWDTNEYIVLATAKPLPEQDPGSHPLCLAYSDIIISGWSDGKVIAYSDETGERLWLIDSAHPGGVLSMALSHNQRFILTGGPTGDVRLWELRTRDLISNLKEHVNKVTSLALSADDTFAISCSRDRCILRWDLREEKRVHCHMQRMGGINAVALAKDERYILSVGQEKKINYWGVESTDAMHSQCIDPSNPETTTDEGKVVVVSHNGKYVLTGGTGGIVRLWDYASSTLLSEAAGHSGAISGITISQDSKQVVSVGEDGSIFYWYLLDNVAGGGATVEAKELEMR
jgi:WD40 repeat protein